MSWVWNPRQRPRPCTSKYETRGQGRKGKKAKREKGHPVTPSPPIPITPSPPHNLPVQLTSFVGREEELAQVAQLLSHPEYRLVTIVGPGGIGKSRLAIEAGSQRVGDFRHGVHFVPLAQVRSVDLLVAAIADVLGVSLQGRSEPRAQLLNFLQDKETLLILDSFEYLLGAADVVLDILQHAPNVTLLVTSQERLNLQAESVLWLQGLSFPRSDQDGAPMQYDAARLFVERAGRAQIGFNPSGQEMRSVIRICQLVEGMPLGIELAAAGVAVSSCRPIARSIQRNFDSLSTSMHDVPERHRSIRAVFEHSWQLLSDEEKHASRKLSVFQGGFREETARQVADTTPALLAQLIDKSLLRQTSSDRYDMHELVRRYAEEKLGEIPREKESAQDLHCKYYADFLRRKVDALKGTHQKGTLEEIQEELDNVRASWEYAIAHERRAMIENMLTGLHLFYYKRGYYREGADAFEHVVNRLHEAGDETSLLVGKLLGRCGHLCHRLGLNEQAKALLQEHLAIARHWNDRAEIALALDFLGQVAAAQGRYPEARRCYQEGLALWEGIGAQRGIADILNGLGNLANVEGDWAEAKRLYGECLAIRREIGDLEGVGTVLNNLANIAYYMGQRAEAERLWEESLAIREEVGDWHGTGVVLNNLGELAFQNRDYGEARRLSSEAVTIKRETGV